MSKPIPAPLRATQNHKTSRTVTTHLTKQRVAIYQAGFRMGQWVTMAWLRSTKRKFKDDRQRVLGFAMWCLSQNLTWAAALEHQKRVTMKRHPRLTPPL